MIDQILPILFDALNSILAIFITFICVNYVRPWIKRLMEDWLVKRAVQAAEKIYSDSGVGEKKKEYVVSMLISAGAFKTDDQGNIPKYWDMLIESAVKAMDLVEGQIKVELDEEEEGKRPT